MNCRAPVPPEDGKFFAKVFCCPTCHTVASRLMESAESELKQMLVIMQETIRIAMVEQKLDFRQEVAALTKKQLFEEIIKLDAIRDVRLQNLDTKEKSR